MSRCPLIVKVTLCAFWFFFFLFRLPLLPRKPVRCTNFISFIYSKCHVFSCLPSFMKEKHFFNGSKPWIRHYLKADVGDVQNNSEIKHDFHWLVQINASFYSSKSLTICVTRPWNSFSLEHSLESCLHCFSPHERLIWEPKWSQNQEISGLGQKNQRGRSRATPCQSIGASLHAAHLETWCLCACVSDVQ